MANGFSVQGVEIEGFKGFATPQSIDFKGRHVFLLGQNGHGKSSIVEAVRWGLFGSTDRPTEVVRNQHYSGRCDVTVKLTRDGTSWTLHRRLSLGTGRGSDYVLTDHQGDRHQIREIMPQLDSVDAGEGTHIIFSPQSAPLRKQPENLDPFEKTVFNYLGLTHPRALLGNLEDFLEEQSESENHLGAELTGAFNTLEQKIIEERDRRSRILKAPPWSGGATPSIGESERKVRNFIGEVSGKAVGDDLDRLSLEALIERAEESLNETRDRDQSSLMRENRELARRRELLEACRDTQLQVREQESAFECTMAQLEAVYNGRTPKELRDQLEFAQSAVTKESIRGAIVRNAMILIGRDESCEVPCPICEMLHVRKTLESSLADVANRCDNAASSALDELQAKFEESKKLDEQREDQENQLLSSKGAAANALIFVDDEDKIKLEELGAADALIEDFSRRESLISAQLERREEWRSSKLSELGKLVDESRFHKIQRQLTALEGDDKELKRVRDSYNALVAFGQTVRAIKEMVNCQFTERLAQDIPRVSETLSKAFSALTQHPFYDRLTFSMNALPKLRLRVANSKDPTGREDPTGVLNGQAESALNLVPYFAFSRTDDTPTEVYLVMMDDPTRSLDEEHTYILLEQLRELGRNVQLIVASQETERFQTMLPVVFDKGNYIIIEPSNWTPTRGPTLKTTCE